MLFFHFTTYEDIEATVYQGHVLSIEEDEGVPLILEVLLTTGSVDLTRCRWTGDFTYDDGRNYVFASLVCPD